MNLIKKKNVSAINDTVLVDNEDDDDSSFGGDGDNYMIKFV